MVAHDREEIRKASDRDWTRGCISTQRSSSDGSINIKGEVVHDRGAIEGCDCNAIVAQSRRNHGLIAMR